MLRRSGKSMSDDPKTMPGLREEVRQELRDWLHDNLDASEREVNEQIEEIADDSVPTYIADLLDVFKSELGLTYETGESGTIEERMKSVIYDELIEAAQTEYSQWLQERPDEEDTDDA
jgi:hypothetical protein